MNRRGLPQLPPDFEVEIDNDRHEVLLFYKGCIDTFTFECWYRHIHEAGFLEHILRKIKDRYEYEWRATDSTVYLQGGHPSTVEGKVAKYVGADANRHRMEMLKKENEPPPPEGSINWDF